MTTTQTHSDPLESRAKQHGEVMTPLSLVREILQKLSELGPEVWQDENEPFLDMSCGTGNWLIFCLWIKLARGHDSVAALNSVFGCDIMKDSISLCRLRLLKIVSLFTTITEDHVRAVLKNIVWVNPKNHPAGSLDYLSEEHRDNAFMKEPRKDDVARWMKYVNEDRALDEIELPVSEEQFERSGSTVDLFAEIEEANEEEHE